MPRGRRRRRVQEDGEDLKLVDLVDLEWLLRPGADAVTVDAERERAVGHAVCGARGVELAGARARLDGDRGLRAALCRGWLDAVRARQTDLPGGRLSRALEIAGWVLVVLGLLVGAGTAKAFLAYDGSLPVNVLHFCAFFFGLQILLLVVMLVFALRARRAGTGGGPGLLHRPIAALTSLFLGGRGRETLTALAALRARRSLYGDVERWTLFALAQRFGASFNLAALFAVLATITFSDLVFSWSTTLDLDAADVHAIVRGLALPWAWAVDAVPSQQVVEASQWDRMQAAFVRSESAGEGAALAAQWWPFLVAGLVVWGLVPRVLAQVFSAWRASRARAAVGLDHAGFQALYDRLLPPAVGWVGPAPDGMRGPVPSGGATPSTAHPPAAAGAPLWIVLWGSLGRLAQPVAEHVARRLGADVRATSVAGGADLAADEGVVAGLRSAGATRVALMFAAGQQPTGEVLEFLRTIRGALGAGRPVIIGLVDREPGGGLFDADPDELDAWRRSLAPLDDPHLWVETMAVPS